MQAFWTDCPKYHFVQNDLSSLQNNLFTLGEVSKKKKHKYPVNGLFEYFYGPIQMDIQIITN